MIYSDAYWYRMPYREGYIYIELSASYFYISPTVYRNLPGGPYEKNCQYVTETTYFWSVGDSKQVLNTVMLIYRHDMSSGLQ